MGWFDRKPNVVPPPAPLAANYSQEKIDQLLHEVGYLRLSVLDPDTKLVISIIAWETPSYIARKSTDGKLPGAVTAELQEQLEMIRNVIGEYVKIQNHPDAYSTTGDVGELLDKGLESLQTFASKITDTSSAATRPDVTGYVVDTRILTTHFN